MSTEQYWVYKIFYFWTSQTEVWFSIIQNAIIDGQKLTYVAKKYYK